MAIPRRTLMAGAAAAAGLAGTTGAFAQSGDKTINIGFFPVVSPVPIMQAQGQLEKKGYKVNWVPLNQGLPGAASALAAGRLDVSWGNSISAVVIFRRRLMPRSSSASPSSTPMSRWWPRTATIKTPADIHGKKVVVSGLKTASTLFFEIGLKKAGVDPASNEYFVSGTGPGMVGVIDSGRGRGLCRLRAVCVRDGAEGYRPRAVHRVGRHRTAGAGRRLHRQHRL